MLMKVVDPSTREIVPLTTDDFGGSGGGSSSDVASWVPGSRSAANLATSGVLMAASPTRLAWIIINTTGVNVYVRYDGTAVTASPGGFVNLIPPGGQLEADGTIAKSQVRVIAPGATDALAYSEGA